MACCFKFVKIYAHSFSFNPINKPISVKIQNLLTQVSIQFFLMVLYIIEIAINFGDDALINNRKQEEYFYLQHLFWFLYTIQFCQL